MKKTIIGLLAAMACATASAGVIGFDDLAGDESAIPAGFAGFDWDNVGAVRADAEPGSAFPAATVSFANTAFNSYGATSTISSATGEAFGFIGAWFTSAWVDQQISFEGRRNGELVYTSDAFTIDTMAPQWIELDWAGIDSLTIYNSSGTQWAMDDFTVPEPGSLALVGGALAGMLGARRRSARRPQA